jgi:hypothetical protein
MDLYVTHLIQQKLKPYLKRVQSVSLVEQIGMVSVEEQALDRQEQENEFFLYSIVVIN